MRRIATVSSVIAFGFLATGCVSVTANEYGAPMTPRATTTASATSSLIGAQGQTVGQATLSQGPTGVLIQIEATGMTPGWHGVHIHATGQCDAPFTSAGAHVNHTEPKAAHGLLNMAGPDDGDLPNIYAHADGTISAQLFTTQARLVDGAPGQGLLDADGSAIVIHASADDHMAQPIGGAGARVACGVIRPQ